MLTATSLDAINTPYMTQFAASWGVLTGSLLIAAPVIWFKIKDTTSIQEDLKFSDETYEDVAPASALEMDRNVTPPATAAAKESDESEKK